jgi:hypothetical protein
MNPCRSSDKLFRPELPPPTLPRVEQRAPEDTSCTAIETCLHLGVRAGESADARTGAVGAKPAARRRIAEDELECPRSTKMG